MKKSKPRKEPSRAEHPNQTTFDSLFPDFTPVGNTLPTVVTDNEGPAAAGAPTTDSPSPTSIAAPADVPIATPLAVTETVSPDASKTSEKEPVEKSVTKADAALPAKAKPAKKAKVQQSAKKPKSSPLAPAPVSGADEIDDRSPAAKAMAKTRRKIKRGRPHRVEAYLDHATSRRMDTYAAAHHLARCHGLEKFLAENLPADATTN